LRALTQLAAYVPVALEQVRTVLPVVVKLPETMPL
jgi:hypothetical protein